MDHEEVSHETVSTVADLTNLDPSTVHDLFSQGWTFHMTLNKPNSWIAPEQETKFNTAEENCGNQRVR